MIYMIIFSCPHARCLRAENQLLSQYKKPSSIAERRLDLSWRASGLPSVIPKESEAITPGHANKNPINPDNPV